MKSLALGGCLSNPNVTASEKSTIVAVVALSVTAVCVGVLAVLSAQGVLDIGINAFSQIGNAGGGALIGVGTLTIICISLGHSETQLQEAEEPNVVLVPLDTEALSAQLPLIEKGAVRISSGYADSPMRLLDKTEAHPFYPVLAQVAKYLKTDQIWERLAHVPQGFNLRYSEIDGTPTYALQMTFKLLLATQDEFWHIGTGELGTCPIDLLSLSVFEALCYQVHRREFKPSENVAYKKGTLGYYACQTPETIAELIIADNFPISVLLCLPEAHYFSVIDLLKGNDEALKRTRLFFQEGLVDQCTEGDAFLEWAED